MKGIAIEHWPSGQTSKVTKWLAATFGPTNNLTWYEDQDYDLFTLVMSDEIYTMYMLRWA